MRRTLLSPYAVGVMSRVGGQALAFVAVMLASRYLGLASFGSYVLAWTVTVITTGLVYTGFYQAQLRSTAPGHDASSYFWLMSLVAMTGSVASVLIGLLVGGTSSETGLAFLLLAPIALFTAPTAWNEAHLVLQQRIRSASLYTLASESAALAVTWTALAHDLGLVALVLGRYAAVFTGFVVTTAMVRRRPRFEITRSARRDSRKTVPNLWGTSALAMFSNYGGDLVLGAFLSTTAVGAYRGGSRITQTVNDLVVQPLAVLSWSRFSRLEKEGRFDEMGEAWSDNMRFASALMWPMMISLLMLAAPLVTVVFDETWLPAAGAVAILALSRSIRFLASLLEPALICTGHNKQQLLIRLGGAVVFLLCLIGFGRYSVTLAAISHGVASVAVAWPAIVTSRRALNLPMSDMPAVFLPGTLMAAGCAGVIALSGPVAAGMGTAPGLFFTIAMVVLGWSLAMAVCLRTGWIRLPHP